MCSLWGPCPSIPGWRCIRARCKPRRQACLELMRLPGQVRVPDNSNTLDDSQPRGRMGRVGRVMVKDLQVAGLDFLPLSPMEERDCMVWTRGQPTLLCLRALPLRWSLKAWITPQLTPLLTSYVCVYVHAHGIQTTTLGVGSLLAPCGLQGMNSGHQVWQQGLLPTESSHQPTSSSLSTNDSSSMPLARPFQIYLYTLYQPRYHLIYKNNPLPVI